MEHFYLFYLFITLFTGVISLGIVIFLYAKTRNFLIGYFLGFYLIFTLVVVLTTLIEYIQINVPLSPILPALKYFLSSFARYALMFSIPALIHHVCTSSHARGKNIVFGGLAVSMGIAHAILEQISNGTIEEFGDVTLDVIFMLVMFYTFIVGLSSIGKLRDAQHERFLRKFMMVFGIFLPGLLIDTLISELFSIPIQIFPILYCGLSIVFAHHFLHYYTAQHILQTSSASVPGEQSENSTISSQDTVSSRNSYDELLARYEVSPREQEIVELILQGYSNQKIGETLFISINTVKAHIKKIYAKCGVKSRYELITLLKDHEKK